MTINAEAKNVGSSGVGRIDLAQLASVHANWIYSAAMRIVRDAHLAEDVTQAVFLVLAKNEGKLAKLRSPEGWIFGVTRFCSLQALREKTRRERHEREAAVMNTEAKASGLEDAASWAEIGPKLDEVVASLRQKDRDAVLLRYYRQMSIAEVAVQMGSSEDAAKKRLSRAVEKLRGMLSRRNVTLPAAGLALLLVAETTHAAPAYVVTMCGSPAASSAVGIHSIANGGIKMMIISKVKIAAIIAFGLIVPAGIATAVLSEPAKSGSAPAPAPSVAAVVAEAPVVAPPAAAEVKINYDAQVVAAMPPQTMMLVSLDPTAVDIKAIEDWKTKFLGTLNLTEDQRAVIDPQFAIYEAKVSDWVDSFKAAGGEKIYVWIYTPEGKPAGIGEVLALGMKPGADKQAITALLPMRLPAHEVVGNMMFMGTNAADLKKIKDAPAQGVPAGAHSDLADGLSSDGGLALRVTMQPAALRNFILAVMPGLGKTQLLAAGMMSLQNVAWDNVVWMSLNLTAPPHETYQMMANCSDAESAIALAKLLNVESSKSTTEQSEDLKVLGDRAAAVIRIKAVADGSRVMQTYDKEAVDAILAYCVLHMVGQDSATTKP